jgi:hypothetical protein
MGCSCNKKILNELDQDPKTDSMNRGGKYE